MLGKDEKVIIVPDVHQNYRFIEKILEKQDLGSGDEWIFLGDFFDPKDPFFDTSEALEKTLTLVDRLILEAPGKVRLLLGNHDVVYYFNRIGSGIARLACNEINRYYGQPDRQRLTVARSLELSAFWECIQLVCYKQGYLFSHAGMTFDHWERSSSVEANMGNINSQIKQPVDAQGDLSSLFRAGLIRGGDQHRGGPLWLDWNSEFTEAIEIPQIVGHTAGVGGRKSGRSYCLDARQRMYGVLCNGVLEVVEV